MFKIVLISLWNLMKSFGITQGEFDLTASIYPNRDKAVCKIYQTSAIMSALALDW